MRQMKINQINSRKIIKIIFISSIALFIVIYAIWRSLNYVKGPSIIIDQPKPFESIEASTTDIIGTALRISKLLLNNREISTDEQGNFKEKIVVFPGINYITIEARDQFERSITKDIQILGTQI